MVPYVALAVLAGAATDRSSIAGGLAGAPIPDRVLHRIGAEFETELLRQLVELHFFETGVYPERLEAVAARAAEADRSLTPERLAAYYYAVRDDEVVLLAPWR